MVQKLEQWDTVDKVLGVAEKFEPLIEELCDKYGVPLALHALAATLGRWCAQQDQDHINGQGLTQNQLMHSMADFYFKRELYMQRMSPSAPEK